MLQVTLLAVQLINSIEECAQVSDLPGFFEVAVALMANW